MLPDNTVVLGQLCFSLSFVISFLPSLVPLFLPLTLVLTPWFLGPGQGVCPWRSQRGDGERERERGQQGGAETDSKTTAAAASPSSLSLSLSLLPSNASPPCLAPSPALPLIRADGYFGARVFVKERDADCVSVYACVSDRELDGSLVMVWRPGSHTKLQSSPREQKREGGRLTGIKPGEQIGTASD